MIITQSNLTNFMLCPYSYFLNQIEGLFAKKESKEVSIGRAYHAGMEAMAESGLDLGSSNGL